MYLFVYIFLHFCRHRVKETRQTEKAWKVPVSVPSFNSEHVDCAFCALLVVYRLTVALNVTCYLGKEEQEEEVKKQGFKASFYASSDFYEHVKKTQAPFGKRCRWLLLYGISSSTRVIIIFNEIVKTFLRFRFIKVRSYHGIILKIITTKQQHWFWWISNIKLCLCNHKSSTYLCGIALLYLTQSTDANRLRKICWRSIHEEFINTLCGPVTAYITLLLLNAATKDMNGFKEIY